MDSTLKRYRGATKAFAIFLSERYPDLEEAGEWDDAIVEFKQSYPLKKSEMENLVAAIEYLFHIFEANSLGPKPY